ncbi:hypothetical protein [Prescottella equi]|uniref:Uncharacterized protein n=1 Tax=Rhodococcus phage REQ2 TaxID=1109713 RepID=G9FH07_9CAUD|nr:hypothetical protein [Prescottella equi]YP_005087108.1 hypothetical protein RoPhREQ2_gp64 [Rhodococcus phage REQ2]AEV51918.1 hypothetical protein [Rhodococcus phage REQ2]
MTDTITPASLRAHADWIGNGPLPAAEHLRREAARLEAESACEGYLLTLAQILYSSVAEYAELDASWDELEGLHQGGYMAGAQAVLTKLAADGRLLPEGGTVLDAEQVAEARELLDAVDLDAEEFHLLRSAFTPPAVSVPDSGPDGTPEKPWPTWQDVPEGATVRAKNRRIYTKRDGALCVGTSTMTSCMALSTEHLAPFVRVDGDKA